MEPSIFGWETFVKSWVEKCNPKWINECRQIVLDLIKWIIPQVLLHIYSTIKNTILACIFFSQSTAFVLKHCNFHLWTDEIKILHTTLDVFQMIMDDAVELHADDYQKFLVSWIQAAMVFATAWGMSGLLDAESRDKFDQFHKRVGEFSPISFAYSDGLH